MINITKFSRINYLVGYFLSMKLRLITNIMDS